jgi:phosphoribosyl 1,2-cyclic phosphate phosphodiesterase
MPAITITVLGSGTSMGVPTLGCNCPVCTSDDARDNRLRPSVVVEYDNHTILIDTTPDFRQQALRTGLRRIDAILYTHAHADHIMGLDDVRPLNFRQRDPIPIYGSEDTLARIHRSFAYVFETVNPESSIPKLTMNTISDDGNDLFGLQFTAVPLEHGKTSMVYGYKFGQAAYLTDHSVIPSRSLELLHGLDVLFLDALRHKPHPTHSTVQQSLDYVQRLSPKRAYFTHISHDLPHARTEEMLPPNVRLAYDGMRIIIEDDR